MDLYFGSLLYDKELKNTVYQKQYKKTRLFYVREKKCLNADISKGRNVFYPVINELPLYLLNKSITNNVQRTNK